jgi:hypothetical protein
MTGNLIQARVRVLWGGTNLTKYDGKTDFPQGQPVVYDVEVSLSAETEGPTASMKWDPTPAGMAVYEYFIKDKTALGTQITIEYFYPGGKKVVFVFIWTGQSISYGNDMTIQVKMQSELAGLINANIRNIAQADTSDTGISAISAIDYVTKQFALEKFKDLIRYNTVAKKDMEKAKLATNYANDTTYGAQVANIAQQTGNMAFANNIGKANIVLFAPFSWDKKTPVKNGVTDIKPGAMPDPTVRYGYLLGPSLITTITRTSEWKPPQQTNQNTPSTQVKAEPPKDKSGDATQQVPSKPQTNTTETQKPTKAPQGTSANRSSPGIGNKDNPDQVQKQNALNLEKSSTLNLSTYLVPALVGIKPHDIIYIPSLKGDFIEDWIVQSVDYNQNDGKVDISIQATRVYGQGAPMNPLGADKFKDYATSNGLIGKNATLSKWEEYAWSVPLGQSPSPAANPQSSRGYGDVVDY